MEKNKKENKVANKITRGVNNVYKNTKEKYNTMTKTGKVLFWMWTGIIIIIIALIITCGNNNSNVSSHSAIEKAIEKAATNYAEDNVMYGSKDSKLIIYIEELVDSGYLKEKEIKDKTCIGYAEYYTKGDLNTEKSKNITKSYIKCKKYVTEGYKNQ